MGKNLPKELELLKQDIWSALFLLNQYKQLYQKSQLRIDLLNETAPDFFGRLQRIYWDQMMMAVSRLTDPHETKSNRSLSVYYLKKYCYDKGLKESIGKDVRALIKDVVKLTKPTRARRDKFLAHRDYEHAVKTIKTDAVLLEDIDDALHKMMDVLNCVLREIGCDEITDMFVENTIDHLIYSLKRAMVYEQHAIDNPDYDDIKANEVSKYFDA
ncbi:MAG: hypothetical protein JXR97_06335 [Planctomycetes bacterium]|nr:hypothetical protein [Planctomycetota bacterium]